MREEWQTRKLGKICTFDKIQGFHDDLTYVGLEDIESRTGRFLGTTNPQNAQSATFRFSQSHVLYGRLRPYLNKVLAPNFEGHCSTEIFPLRPSQELDREFLFYWLLSEQTCERIDATCTGARMPRAQMNVVLEFDFSFPSRSEQHRIVALLDEAFAGLATARVNAERNLQNARALFESHLESVFSRQGEDWMEMPLAELCDVKHGYAFDGRFFSSQGDYVLLTPGNFYEHGGYRDRGEKQKYFIGDIPKEYVLNKGDLLVAMTEQATGLLGSPILVPESGKFLHNQRLGLVRRKTETPWTNEFFFHVFNTRHVRSEIQSSASGVKVRHTSPSKIGNILVSFPGSLDEQRKIVNRLTSLTEEIQRLTRIYEYKLAALEELKASLLHQAFNGEL